MQQPPGRTAALAGSAALSIAAGLLVSHSVYEIPFLYSELAGIVQSPVATDLGVFWERMVTPRGLLERPLSVLSYALNHAAHGSDVWGYHAVNVAIHALNTVLVVLLAPRFAAAPWAAGLLFAVHPLATACTGQVFGRNYSLAMSFCLAALLALIRWRRRGAELGPGRLAVLVALCAGAFLSKQTLVVFPAVLLWWEICRPGDRSTLAVAAPRAPSKLRLALLAAAAAAFGVAAIQLYAAPLSATATITPREFALSQLAHLDALASLYLLPHQTALVHDLPLYDDWRTPRVALGALVVAAATAAAWRWRRHPAGWLLGAVLLCLLPTNTLLPKNEIVREWRLYPSLAFVALLAGHGIAWLRTRTPRRWQWPPRVAFGLWILLLGHATTVQHHHYRSRVSAWAQVLARYPEHADAMNNLGTLRFGRGEHEPALGLFERAASAAPRVSLYRMNLARAWAQLGDPERARLHARLARELEGRYGELKMAVRHADGRRPGLPPELERALSQADATADAEPRAARAPRRMARLVPRAEFPAGSRFADLYHEGDNARLRGALPEADGEVVAQRWRDLAGDVAGVFVLRDSLFGQQDHLIEQRAFASTLPTDWLVAAAEAADTVGVVRGLALPAGDDGEAWSAAATPDALFGSFPASGSLYRWATSNALPLREPLRTRVLHARHALRALEAHTTRLVAAAQRGGDSLLAEGAEIVSEQDRRYFGAALRREKIIPLLVATHPDAASGTETRVHRALLRRRLADGDAAIARFDPEDPAQARAAVALARDALSDAPEGEQALRSHLWLFLGGASEAETGGDGPGAPPSPAAIAALRSAASAAGVPLDRLRFAVRIPARHSTAAERKRALLERLDEYASEDVYLALEHPATELFEAIHRENVRPIDFAAP